MKIYKDRSVDKLYLSLKKYLKKVVEYFGMQNCKLISTPLTSHFKLSSTLSQKTKEEKKHMLGVSYASIVKSIVCVMVCTHLDISYIVSVVNRFLRNHSKVH
jgi:hypothetical protein